MNGRTDGHDFVIMPIHSPFCYMFLFLTCVRYEVNMRNNMATFNGEEERKRVVCVRE